MSAQYLLDTHVLIWLAQSPEDIPASAKGIISSDNELFFSYASVWEMSIKIKTGKLDLGQPLDEFIQSAVDKYEIALLPISLNHLYYTQGLPLHHRDPFDRLLIAQSKIEEMPLISSDEIVDLYTVERIWK